MQVETETRREGIEALHGYLTTFIRITDDQKSAPLYRLGKTFIQQGKLSGDETLYGIRSCQNFAGVSVS